MTALTICASPDSANASDVVELSRRAITQYLEKVQLAYPAGLSAYRTSLQSATAPSAAAPTRSTTVETGDPVLRQLITDASNQFGVPERWIRAIMRVESAGATGATSSKGAMGLMQVMPETYADLRERLGLSDDPYAVRDNILAGSAYIREMYDRYGWPGFIAAYNAGPARYGDYLANGRELPEETARYVVAVGTALGENFEGSVLGKLPLGGRTSLRFREPISISTDGQMLESRTGQPVTVTDRLALHGLLTRAVGLAGSR